MKDQIKKSGTLLASIGTLGGFIADVLTPLGPFTKWIFIIFIVLTIVLFITYLKNRSFGKKYFPISLILSTIFGFLFLINGDSKSGVLGDNIDGISSMQNSLFNLQESVDRIENKIDVVSDKLDLGFDKIEELIKLNNPIENPSTPKDFIVNAYLFKSSGLLKKSQFSFEEYFRLADDFKVDVLLDYCDVFESNNGYKELKAQLELLPITESTKLVKLLRTSFDDKSLYLSLISEGQENESLSKWAVLTLPPTIANGFERGEMFIWIYNSMTYHVSLGYYCEEVEQFFFNKSKASDFINTNTFTNSPGYFFYVDYKQFGQSTNSWYSQNIKYKHMVQELDSLYLANREEGWFR